MAYILLADNNVEDVWEQPPAVIYTDSKGEKHKHTFDFLVRFKSGERVAIAVKPYSRVEPSKVRTVLKRIRQQTGSKFADKFCICTEAEITRELAHNSRLIVRCRRMSDELQIAKMAKHAANLNGAVAIGELAYSSGLRDHALPAIVNLIDRGLLEVSDGRIDHFSSVRLKGQATARSTHRAA